MIEETIVTRSRVLITNSQGLHLRPAGKFVALATKYQSEIRVHYNGNVSNGKSILDLTTLAANCGAELELEAWGPDSADAVRALAELVLARFHEPEDEDEVKPEDEIERNGDAPGGGESPS